MRLDESHLARSIAAAFDRLPEPEAARLKALEEGLARKIRRPPATKKSRASYWWLLAGLAATGAAAWWGGQYLSGGSSATAVQQPAVVSRSSNSETVRKNRARPAEQPPAQSSPRSEAAEDGSSELSHDSPQIYRREKY